MNIELAVNWGSTPGEKPHTQEIKQYIYLAWFSGLWFQFIIA